MVRNDMAQKRQQRQSLVNMSLKVNYYHHRLPWRTLLRARSPRWSLVLRLGRPAIAAMHSLRANEEIINMNGVFAFYSHLLHRRQNGTSLLRIFLAIGQTHRTSHEMHSHLHWQKPLSRQKAVINNSIKTNVHLKLSFFFLFSFVECPVAGSARTKHRSTNTILSSSREFRIFSRNFAPVLAIRALHAHTLAAYSVLIEFI